ncbi:MAG: hypothetical protein AMXMBFR61_04880 [Fimbriimonadales bacterium]
MADKKVLIVGALAVALLGVGALQFIGGPKNEPRPEPKQPKKQAETKGAEPAQEMPLPDGVRIGPVRDPFAKPAGATAATETGPGRLPDGTRFRPPEAERPTQAIDSPKLEPLGGNPPPSLPAEKALNGCGWEAVGVVVGPVPIVVLRNATGEQVLVREGHTADDTTRILKVTPRSVTVRHLKKTVTLAIGGGVVEDKK